jgi:hypothetical protein
VFATENKRRMRGGKTQIGGIKQSLETARSIDGEREKRVSRVEGRTVGCSGEWIYIESEK